MTLLRFIPGYRDMEQRLNDVLAEKQRLQGEATSLRGQMSRLLDDLREAYRRADEKSTKLADVLFEMQTGRKAFADQPSPPKPDVAPAGEGARRPVSAREIQHSAYVGREWDQFIEEHDRLRDLPVEDGVNGG